VLGIAARDHDGLEPERLKIGEQLGVPALVRLGPTGRLAAAQPHQRHHTGPWVADWQTNAAYSREALLPYRILDHDRHEIPPATQPAQPRRGRRRREEVGEHEHKAAGRQAALPRQ
jgi:hypothetical protein